MKYPWVPAQEGKRISVLFYLCKGRSERGEVVRLLAPSTCGSTGPSGLSEYSTVLKLVMSMLIKKKKRGI